MPWLLLLVPTLAGVALWAVGDRHPRVLAPGAAAALGVALALSAWASVSAATASFRWGPGLDLTLAVAGFGRVMVVLVPAISLPVVVYATSSEARDPARARLIGLLVAFVGVMELLVAAGDVLTLLIGWELVGALSWALIGHHWRDAEVTPRAAHAFITTRFGDAGLYLAAGAVFAGSGSFSYASIGALGRPQRDLVAAGLLLAAAAKSAQLPFAPWLFSAMAGPTPVSALLHSATMVAAGAYVLIRLGPAFEPLGWFGPTVIAIGLATTLAGGVVAFIQTDFKKSLAASTSAQYGLMFIAIGAGSVAAGAAHLVTQAAFKALLFLSAGIALHATGSGELGRMRLGSALPRVAVLAGVGVLALAAVPPLGGAYSKEAVLAAGVEAGPWVGGGVVLAGLLSALYAGRLQLLAYGPDRSDVPNNDPGTPDPKRSPGPFEIAAMVVLAVFTVGLSALWLPASRRFVETVVGSGLTEGSAWELGLSALSIAAGLVTVRMLDRRGKLLSIGMGPRLQTVAGDWLGLPLAARRLVVDPVLALADVLARVDDRVIDAGIRGVAAGAAALSDLLSWWAERGIDGVVAGVAGATLRSADASRSADERGVDAAVDGLAAGIGRAGTHARTLQSGLTHHYYVMVGVGAVVIVLVGALWRT